MDGHKNMTCFYSDYRTEFCTDEFTQLQPWEQGSEWRAQVSEGCMGSREVSLSEQPRAKAEYSSPSWVGSPPSGNAVQDPSVTSAPHISLWIHLRSSLSIQNFTVNPCRLPQQSCSSLLTSLLPFLHKHLPKPSHSKPAAALTRDTKPALSHIYCSW